MTMNSYISSDNRVIDVDSSGDVTAKGEGTAKVSYIQGDKVLDTVEITVEDNSSDRSNE